MTAVNTLLADLTSSSMLHVQLALTTLSYVLTADTVPIFRDKVISKLSCDAPPIRRAALSALHKMYSIDGPAVDDRLTLKIQAAVCDADPSVMACVLPLIIDELVRDRSALTKVSIVSSALCILKQVLEGKLKKSFEYFGVPAPWIQVRYYYIHYAPSSTVITVQCSASCCIDCHSSMFIVTMIITVDLNHIVHHFACNHMVLVLLVLLRSTHSTLIQYLHYF
jgi:vesicle coat complex subunit